MDKTETKNTPLAYYKNRHGGYSIKKTGTVLIGSLVDVGGAIDEETASLFAAAPELLEALKTWEKFWDTMPKGQLGKLVLDVGLLNEAFIKMGQAIAKAEPK